MSYPPYAFVLFFIGAYLANKREDINTCTWFRSSIWWIVSVLGLMLQSAIKSQSDNMFENSWLALFDSLAKLMLTPLILKVIAMVDIQKVSTSKVYLFAKELSFFAYAGHFLFCSILVHSIAPMLNFSIVGIQTLCIFIFVVIGTLCMSLFFILFKRLLPRTIKILDGTL